MSRKECDARYYAKHREERIKAVIRHRLQRYGISQELWDEKFEEQGRCCAICKSPDPKSTTGWHTDHDHETNKFRGILCRACNTSLGAMQDSIELLQNMIAYLKYHVAEQRA